MLYKSKILGLYFIVILVTLIGCQVSSTDITGTWVNEDATKNYEELIVTALSSSTAVKMAFEDELSKSLAKENVVVKKGINIFPFFMEKKADKEEMLDVIQAEGAEAILTVSIVDKDTEARYIPGTVAYSPYPAFTYYGSFWSYYDYWYPYFSRTGYYTVNSYYYLETNLYDAETEQLIWSAQTATYDPATIESFSDDFAEEIVGELKKGGLI